MRNRRSLSSPTARVKAMVVPSGDHAGAPACSVPSVSWRALTRGDVEHVHLVADGAEHPGAVGLVVEPVGDQRATGAGVDGRGEREPRTVRAPHRSPRAEREVGDPLGLASVGGQQVDLTVPDERDPRPVRRPAGEVSAWPVVSRRGVPPDVGTVQSWSTLRSSPASSVRSTYTTRSPSGESAGWDGTARSVRSSIRIRRVMVFSLGFRAWFRVRRPAARGCSCDRDPRAPGRWGPARRSGRGASPRRASPRNGRPRGCAR